MHTRVSRDLPESRVLWVGICFMGARRIAVGRRLVPSDTVELFISSYLGNMQTG